MADQAQVLSDFLVFHVGIHGIRPEDVANSPDFASLWDELGPMLSGRTVVAHNAGFDISVLRCTLAEYRIPNPALSYTCSYQIAKRAWPSAPAYDLKTLCRTLSIGLDHHRAAADSRASAEVLIRATQAIGASSFDDLLASANMRMGELFLDGYRPSSTIRAKSVSDPIVGDPSKYDAESMFFGKKVVFTGTLSSMTRAEAQQMIADIGGVIGGTVTSETDFLIVGQQDFRVVGDDGLSGKQEKALKLRAKGVPVEVISEQVFLQNL